MESQVNTASPKQVGAAGKQSSSSVVRNAFVANFATLFGIVTAFFLTPLLLHALGTENFGIWSIITTLVGQLGMIQLGLNVSIPRQVAIDLSLGQKEKLAQLFSTAYFTFIGCGVITLVFTAIGVANPTLFMKVKPSDLAVVRTAILILGVNQALSFIIVFRNALNFGTGRLYVTSSLNVLVNTVMTLGFVAVARVGWGIRGMACIMLISTVLNLIFYRHLLSDEFSTIRPRVSMFKFSLLVDLFKTGRDSFIISLAGAFGTGLNIFIISALLSPVHVTFYSIAAKLISFVASLTSKFSSTSLPTYSQAFAQGDMARIQRIYTESVSVGLGILLPFIIVSCVLGNRVILAWVGPGHEESALLWMLGMFGYWCRIPGEVAFTLFYATNKTHKVLIRYLCSGIVNCGLSYVLTLYLGAKGVIISTIIVAGIVDFLWLPAFTCREFKFSLRQFWIDTLHPLLPSVLVGLGIAVLIYFLSVPQGTAWTLSSVMLIILPVWFVWFQYGLPVSRREKFQSVFRKAFSRG